MSGEASTSVRTLHSFAARYVFVACPGVPRDPLSLLPSFFSPSFETELSEEDEDAFFDAHTRLSRPGSPSSSFSRGGTPGADRGDGWLAAAVLRELASLQVSTRATRATLVALEARCAEMQAELRGTEAARRRGAARGGWAAAAVGLAAAAGATWTHLHRSRRP